MFLSDKVCIITTIFLHRENLVPEYNTFVNAFPHSCHFYVTIKYFIVWQANYMRLANVSFYYESRTCSLRRVWPVHTVRFSHNVHTIVCLMTIFKFNRQVFIEKSKVSSAKTATVRLWRHRRASRTSFPDSKSSTLVSWRYVQHISKCTFI